MTSLKITEADVPDLRGKVAVVTGGSSGIGYAAACILAGKGATVHILDIHPPSATDSVPAVLVSVPANIIYHPCDVTDWVQLRGIFAKVGSINYAFANAGISETENFPAHTYEKETAPTTDKLLEPSYPLFGVNLRAVLNTIKLAHHSMKKYNIAGSIVITSSATAYAPEQSLPVYSAIKLALIGLVRSLRNNLTQGSISINAVVPAATETRLIAPEFLGPIKQFRLPLSSARHVGLALVYSAIAKENRKVEVYGKEENEQLNKVGRWNGRVILALGDTWTELEEPLADLKPQWFGEVNTALTKKQQAMTDFRNKL